MSRVAETIDAVTAARLAEVEQMAAEAEQPVDPAQARHYLAAQAPRVAGAAERMARLARPPRGDAASVAAWLAQVAELADDLDALHSRGMASKVRGLAGILARPGRRR